MSGVNSIMNIASQALMSQQYALSVTGQNIANVDNPDFTNQKVVFEATAPQPSGGLYLGTGTQVKQITQSCDLLLEKNLMQEKSNMAAWNEMAYYTAGVESLFNDSASGGLSTCITDFWNSWEDLSVMPDGAVPRSAVLESGAVLAENINGLSTQLSDMGKSLEKEIAGSVASINEITSEIADLNKEIAILEAGGANANDLQDKRGALLGDLAELTDIDYFQDDSGCISVMTAGGYPLVSGESAYSLAADSGQVMWKGSQGDVNISDSIGSGKLGGQLEMNDAVIPEIQAELDSLSEEIIWAVNLEHSSGAGQDYFSESLTGTYAADSSGLVSTLTYGERIDTSEGMTLFLEDGSSQPPLYTEVHVDLSGAAPISSPDFDVTGTANLASETYTFNLDPPGSSMGGGTDVTVTWSSGRGEGSFTVPASDTSGVYEVDGFSMTMSDEAGPFLGGTFVVTTDENGKPSENVSQYTMEDLAKDINSAVVSSGGGVTATVQKGQLVISPDSESMGFAFGESGGFAAALGLNTFFTGSDAASMGVNEVLDDKDLIAAGNIDPDTFAVASGDNTNALSMASLGDKPLETCEWNYSRGKDPVSHSAGDTAQGFYLSLSGSIGITAGGIDTQMKSSQALVDELQVRRDSISAVSLDEEMINLSRHQASYEAAARLISVADEMMQTILDLK